MTHKLIQRQSARRDILAIVDRILDDNPSAAAVVYEAYESSLELLNSTLHVSFGRWHGKSLMHLSPRLRPSFPRQLATDAESADTRRGGKDVVTASG